MGLIAHYPLNDSAENVIGETSSAPINISWVKGKIGGGARFNGVGSYIDGGYVPTGGELSVSFWTKLDSLGNNWFVGKRDNGSDKYWQIQNYEGSSGDITVNLADSDGSWVVEVNGSFGLQTGRWYHIAFATRGVKGSSLTLYVNGVENASGTLIGDMNVGSTMPVIIGSRAWAPGGVVTNGIIDDVRIYDHTLSKREVRDLSLGLLSHFPLTLDTVDCSGLVEGVNVNATLSYQGALFTGVDSYIDLGTPARHDFENNAPLTVAAWISPNSFTTRDIIFSKNPFKQAGPYTFLFGLINGNMQAYTGSTWQGFVTNDLIPLNVDGESLSWTHICWTFDGTILKGFVNGVEVGSRNDFAYTNNSTHTTKIGGYNDTSDFDGWVRDHRVYATALSADQVKEICQQKMAMDGEGSVHSTGTNESIPYVSPSSAGQVNFLPTGYNDVHGQSGPCSGLKTFEEALQYAHDQGGRLPTKEELENNATAGSGCGYNFQLCWSCDQGVDSSEHWVVAGISSANIASQVYKNTQKAYVRFVADIDVDRVDPVTTHDNVIKQWMML